MRSRKLLALLFCLITFPAIAGYMTLLGAGVGNISPIVSWDAGTDAFPDASLTYSGPSLSTMFDSTGKLTYKPNNLLLNTATLNTQTVTVQVGVNYLLSIKGTGSVTLTGASTAGPLNGTGASNRVDLKITAATSSLTLTVSGSVTSARLSAVTYETAFRTVNDVNNVDSAYYGPRIDYDPNTLAVKGLLIEEARTNTLIQSGNFSASWSAIGANRSTDGTLGPDGSTAMAKYTANASTGVHEFYNTAAVSFTSGSNYTSSIFVKKGNHRYVFINMETLSTSGFLAVFDLDNPTAATQTWALGTGSYVNSKIENFGGIYRIQVTGAIASGTTAYLVAGFVAAATGNPTTSLEPSWTAAGTEYGYFFGAQLELGSFATSYIPTAAASVTRAADVFQFTEPALTALQGTAGTFIVESISESGSSPAAITNIVRGTNSIIYHDTTGKTGTTNGTTALLTAAAPTWNASLRNGLAWSASGRSLAYTGGAVATDANTVSNGGTLYLGSNNGSAVENGWYKSFGIWNQRLDDSTFQTKLTVGGSYAVNDNGIRYAFADNDNLPIHWRVAL
jgi:hypothetical protein